MALENDDVEALAESLAEALALDLELEDAND